MVRRSGLLLLLLLAIALALCANAQVDEGGVDEANDDPASADGGADVAGGEGSGDAGAFDDAAEALEQAGEAMAEALPDPEVVVDAVKEAAHAAAEGAGAAAPASAVAAVRPKSDWDCRFSWSTKRCEPADYCEYQYQILDATPTESCRRKGAKKGRHEVTGGVEMPPAAAVAGATALFAADLGVVAYTPALKRAPLLTNIVQGFVLFLSGDTYFQVIEQGWQDKIKYKLARAAKSGVVGAINNGLVHFSYYKWIDKHFPYHRFTEKRWGPKDGALHKLIVAWTKYWIEWPTIGLYKIASSFALTAFMNNDLASLPNKFQKRFMLTWLRSLQVWPLYDTFAYAYISTENRVLFNTFMSIAWGGYLAHLSQPEVHDIVGEHDEL